MSHVSVVLLFICWLIEEGGGVLRLRPIGGEVPSHTSNQTSHCIQNRTRYFSGIKNHRPILCLASMASVYFDPTHLYRLFLSLWTLSIAVATVRSRQAKDKDCNRSSPSDDSTQLILRNNVSLSYFKQRFFRPPFPKDF